MSIKQELIQEAIDDLCKEREYEQRSLTESEKGEYDVSYRVTESDDKETITVVMEVTKDDEPPRTYERKIQLLSE